MLSSFNLEKVRQLFKDFYSIAQIRITLFNENFEELVSYPDTPPKICCLLRKIPAAREQCQKCDKASCKAVFEQHTCTPPPIFIGVTQVLQKQFLRSIWGIF